MTFIESREMFKSDELRVVATMYADQDDPNFPQQDDGEDDAEFVAAYRSGELQYVGLEVEVSWDDVRLSMDALWGVEHGTVGDLECDAWKLGAPEYPAPDAIVMAQPLSGAILETLYLARTTADKLGIANPRLDAALIAANNEFDPNRKAM